MNISQAINSDFNRQGRGQKYNPQVLTGKQELTEEEFLKASAEYQAKKQAERAYARQLREAEGGKGGGYNDRQDPQDRKPPEDEGEVDDFGRRRKTTAADGKQLSKAERAKLAMERLKQKASGRARSPSPAGASSSKRRSRSPRR
eukprot:TRINITY_DN85180_c0_g1_i1.p1 TRINITY_DN85180_c0_g1~~TRINITY_DN85180_c0_g1_i1.p1  ORF type:complete len:145 (-),score=38.44 TRINITY_DN85180_c0_g1_i1:227-661(-)